MSFEFIPGRWLDSPFVIGTLGSFVGLRFAPGLSWWERAGNVASGAACAGLVVPGLAAWLGVGEGSVRSTLAFLVGLFALSLCAAVFEAIRNLKLADIVSGWISRRG